MSKYKVYFTKHNPFMVNSVQDSDTIVAKDEQQAKRLFKQARKAYIDAGWHFKINAVEYV